MNAITLPRPVRYWLDAIRCPLQALTDDELHACHESAMRAAYADDKARGEPSREITMAENTAYEIGEEFDRRATQSNHQRMMEAGKYSRQPTTYQEGEPYGL